MTNNCIPLKLTNKYGSKYPDVWKKIDDIYIKNAENKNPNYINDFWFMLSNYKKSNKSIVNVDDITVALFDQEAFILPGMLDALYKWRIHKQIYRFSIEMEKLLYEQNDGFDSPIWILNSLPYNCIYIETNELSEDTLGFFFYKDYKSYTAIVIYNDMSWKNITFNYDEKTDRKTTLKESVNRQAVNDKCNVPVDSIISDGVYSLLPKIVQLVLYICASNAEISENAEQKKITRKPKSKDFIKDKYREVQIWDCGNEISEKIRMFSSQEKSNKRSENSAEYIVKAGVGKAPHSRRGHWHHFWTGKIGTDDRKLVLKWLAPMFINGVPNIINVNIAE